VRAETISPAALEVATPAGQPGFPRPGRRTCELGVVTGFKATRAAKLTPGQKEANRILAATRVPVEHGFAHLRNWPVLTKLRTGTAAPPSCCACCSS
jgi:hypothetical protein